VLRPRNVFGALTVSSFYHGVQALATWSRFQKMCYFGKCITPVLDIIKKCDFCDFSLAMLGTRIFKLV
jgi:hypothetical protein